MIGVKPSNETVSEPSSFQTSLAQSFTYDTAGRKTGMTDATGTTGYTYDNANRTTQVVTPNGTVSYAYDNGNRRTGMTLTGTGSWSYAYDAVNRLTSTTNPYSETTTFSYDNANRMTGQTNANGSTVTNTYDNANRTTDVLHKTSANATLAHYAYAYDGVNNVTTRTDTDGTVTTFGYDNSDQVTSEVRGGGSGYTIGYTYDHNQNRKTKVLNGVTDTYSYDSHDHLLSTSSKSYTYDANGNCKTVVSGTSTTTLTYDDENRVTGITYPSSATNSFTYNGLGLRVSKNDSAGAFAYVCDGTDVASAVLKDGAATYTPGLSERRGSTSKFTHKDALGSTRGITDSSQSVTDSILFDAFGMTVSRTGTTPTPFGFVGGAQYQTDADSGLMLLGHRYYDASIGRFISEDPIQAGDNWYAYCGNNPLNATDPSGLDGSIPIPGLKPFPCDLGPSPGSGVRPNPPVNGGTGAGFADIAKHWGDNPGDYKKMYPGSWDDGRTQKYTDCGVFVHEVVKGYDPQFPSSGTSNQREYITDPKAGGKNWISGPIGGNTILQPGDILNHVGHPHHTAIVVENGDGGLGVIQGSLGGHEPRPGPLPKHLRGSGWIYARPRH